MPTLPVLCLLYLYYACTMPTMPVLCLYYAYYACTMPTMPVLCLLCLYYAYYACTMPTMPVLCLLCLFITTGPSSNLVAASVEVSKLIAQHGKPLSDGDYIKKAWLECAPLLLGQFLRKRKNYLAY